MLSHSTRTVPEPSTSALISLCVLPFTGRRKTRHKNWQGLRSEHATTAAVLAVLLCAAPSVATTPEAISRFNTVVGTQTIAPAYGFTSESRLYESASRIREMGSNTLKISLTGDAYEGMSGAPSDLTQLAQWGDFKRVLDMDFSHYHFWAYSVLPQAWNFGDYTQFEQDLDYQTIYNLSSYLLTNYSGTGKTFYIGNWEGDWHLVGQGNVDDNPTQQQIDQMAEWYNVRQSAIEDAKNDLAGQVSDVDVFQYAEVNLVPKAIADTDPNDEVLTLTNDVLPQTNIDYVSYSSWGSLNSLDLEVVDQQLIAAFDHIEAQLQPKAGLPTEKRVFLGEYGWRLPRVGTAEEQERYSRDVALTALEWGAPFALYWEFYDNSLNNGNNYGFWLIDDQDEKQPLYHTFANYYDASEAFLTGFSDAHGRLPTEAEYRDFATQALASVASALQSTTPGDFDGDGVADAADYTLWRDGLANDFGSDGYYVWRGDFGATSPSSSSSNSVPEPSAVLLVLCGVLSRLRLRVVRH